MKRIPNDARLLLAAELRRAADLLEPDPSEDEGYEGILILNHYKGADNTIAECEYRAHGGAVMHKTIAIAKVVDAMLKLNDVEAGAILSCVEHALEGLERAKRIEAELNRQAKSRLN